MKTAMLHVQHLYLCSFTSSCMFRTVGQEIQCFLNKMETTVHLSSPLPFIWLIYKTRLTYNSTHIRSTKESLTFEYLNISWYWWYWASRSHYWLVLGGTGSVWVVLVRTWWYWVSMERNWLIHDGTWSVQGSTG